MTENSPSGEATVQERLRQAELALTVSGLTADGYRNAIAQALTHVKAARLQALPAQGGAVRAQTIEECAKIVEGRVHKEHYREWPEWGPGNRSNDSELVKFCDVLAEAIRNLAASPSPELRSPGREIAQAWKPFAKILEDYAPQEDDSFKIWVDAPDITLGHLRQLAAALPHAEQGAGEKEGE